MNNNRLDDPRDTNLDNLYSAVPARAGLFLAALLPMVLGGCGGGITRLEVDPAVSTVCNSTNTSCGFRSDQPVRFRVWGQGKCGSVGLKFGDGTTVFSGPFDFGKAGTTGTPWEVSHTYEKRWPGPKTAHAYSASDCVGEQKLRVDILHAVSGGGFRPHFALGLGQPVTTACNEVPNIVTALRPNTRVTIRTNPNPQVKINFGCALGGCIYDADGEANSSAPANYPFPGLRKYSLVLRVGGQVVQGGTNMSFTTTGRGRLEVCVNDDDLPNNTGAWGIDIFVDETQAP